MDHIDNPFSPGAGSPPPELVGRSNVIDEARILLGRVKLRRPEKSILLTGLRGVGKTVLLNEIERLAKDAGYRSITIEAHENKSLAGIFIPQLKQLFFELDRMAGVGQQVRRGLSVLKSFAGAITVKTGDVEFGLDIDPEKGTADSGDLEVDLPQLFIALGEAALARSTPIAILIDEIQYLNSNELSALIMAMHKIQQKQLPIVLVAAGLPILPGMAGESKSYAERLFSFPYIGPLSQKDAERALIDPVQRMGVSFEREALGEIYDKTQGYPYFLQEWGYQAWNQSESANISLHTVQSAYPKIIARLDENFFRVRFNRLTAQERRFLRAMAELGKGPFRIGDVADILGAKLSGLGPVRAKLIKKGMIYSPSHGEIAFTVPLFDEYMRRVMPDETLI